MQTNTAFVVFNQDLPQGPEGVEYNYRYRLANGLTGEGSQPSADLATVRRRARRAVLDSRYCEPAVRIVYI